MSRLTDLISWNDHTRTILSDLRKCIAPGLPVAVGFIDPGNRAATVAAGSLHGYYLLVTLSTIMLIILQYNAHLGIATGLCLSGAANHLCRTGLSSRPLSLACLAACATAMINGLHWSSSGNK